ncbi:hypothetical protein [Streptomyces sp. NPDC029003]|uniref:hypothetical protein n=1 Tax=Streptomyces sp. NPDC029003 TaxID=3155125 RepID=UPI0033F49780
MDADGTPDEVVDALYADPPDGFTAARDAAVARAKADGDTATAKRVAGLRRPTLAAWVSNTLVRAQPEEAERFLQLGQALREAHRSLDGEQLRELSHQQHVVVGALAREAQRLAGEAGTAVSEPVVREVERILYTALADPDAATAWASARLTRAPAEAASFPQADPSAVRDHRPPRGPAGAGAEGDADAATDSRTAGAVRAPASGPPDSRSARARSEAAREAGREAAAREAEAEAADGARRRAVDRAAEADAELTRLEEAAERARAERDLAHAALSEAETRLRAATRTAREARRAAAGDGQP